MRAQVGFDCALPRRVGHLHQIADRTAGDAGFVEIAHQPDHVAAQFGLAGVQSCLVLARALRALARGVQFAAQLVGAGRHQRHRRHGLRHRRLQLGMQGLRRQVDVGIGG